MVVPSISSELGMYGQIFCSAILSVVVCLLYI
jgi:hypothetical protein